MKALKSLYVQVLLGVAVGVTLGLVKPGWSEHLRVLGDAFIRLVKMCIAPIVFLTVAGGIAKVGDLRRVGRIGLKALVYFEALTTVALVIGLAVVKLVEPGKGMGIDPASLDQSGLAALTQKKAQTGLLEQVIPESVVGAFARGEVLGVLLFALLFGVGLSRLGDRGKPLLHGLHLVEAALFEVIGLIMRLAPLGAMGAMAFTVGKHGTGALLSLGKLMGCFYATALAFVLIVLTAMLKIARVPVWRFFRYLRDELVLVLGTSSSESALPRLIEKLERAGCSPAVVGLVVPTGYSFNLDGTSIYLTMAALFVAQATGTELTLGQELGLLGVLLLTSKGAAAVSGGGFVTLAATLATTGTVPVAGLALLVGIDRFMSEARALVNLVGNAVATMVVARWEGALDDAMMQEALGGRGLSRAPGAVAADDGDAAA